MNKFEKTFRNIIWYQLHISSFIYMYIHQYMKIITVLEGEQSNYLRN